MKKNSIALAGVAMAFLLGGVGSAFAQADPGMEGGSHRAKKPLYRPLKVTPRPAPVAPAAGLGDALAAPFNAVGAVGGPVGVAGSIAGGTVAGATSLAFAPIATLTGGGVGISATAAPPLPIEARYANTGKVTATYDQGFAQDVPVDASGPIYKLNYNKDGARPITPFSLLAFPVSAATYAVTAPVRTLVH